MSVNTVVWFVAPQGNGPPSTSVENCNLIPGWEIQATFFSLTRTADELSIVTAQEYVPEGVQCERGWKALKIEGSLDLSLTGVLGSVCVLLAEAGISVFAISTFDTDYVLVSVVC